MISLGHSGSQHHLQFHHVFPKAQLKAAYTAREADDISNLAFIGGKTNRIISDKPPVEYLPALVAQHGSALFEAQQLPLSPHLLEIKHYHQFLVERRKLIAARINEYLTPPTAG
jgi:hypothetical protein